MTGEFVTLLNNKGIPKSRHQSLWEGCKAMHEALCYLDTDNFNVIDDMGVDRLINYFALAEEVRVLPFKNSMEK